VAWTLTAVTVIAAVWTLGLAWAAVRGAFLTSTSLSDIGDDLQMVLAAVALAAVFAISIGAAGFVSGLRAALWSVDRLR
jgi:hypothetical protein